MACGVGAGVLFASTVAWAECRLELVPADAPAPWTSAVRAATSRLRSGAAHDCSSVEVAVRPSGGALVTFTTTDGRRAVRALTSAEELGPTLDALLVTLPSEPTPQKSAPSPPVASAAPSPPSEPPRPLVTRVTGVDGEPPPGQGSRSIAIAVPTAAPPHEAHFQLGASVGGRFGFKGAFFTPAIGFRPSGTFGAWELAGAVEYDSSYTYLPGGSPPGFNLWSFIAAVQVGRRQAFGNVALGYGLGLGVASIREEANDVDGTAKVTDFGQPRLSLYGHLVFPRRSTWRGTLDLGLDAALGSVMKRASLRADLPDLPRWGIVVSAGVETSAL